VFWKNDQFNLMNIIIKFFNLDCTYILSAQLYILECIYSSGAHLLLLATLDYYKNKNETGKGCACLSPPLASCACA
jgi:hypothetical protein